MTIKLSQDPDKDLTVLKCEGEAKYPETIEILNSFFKSPTKRCLWDMSGLEGDGWSYKEIESINQYSAVHGLSDTEVKMAFAASSDLDFGISCMYKVCAQLNEIPGQVEVFRSREEALGWLGAS